MGVIGGTPFIGLPGNPVASFVTFAYLARPAILALSGTPMQMPSRRPGPRGLHLSKKSRAVASMSALVCARAADGAFEAVKFPREGAGLLSSLVETDGLVELREQTQRRRARPERCLSGLFEPGLTRLRIGRENESSRAARAAIAVPRAGHSMTAPWQKSGPFSATATAQPRPAHRVPAPDPGQISLSVGAPSAGAGRRDAAGAGRSLRGRLVLRPFRRGQGRRSRTGANHDQGVRFDQLHAGGRGDAFGRAAPAASIPPPCRVVRAPCVGRCAGAPAARIGDREVDNATSDGLLALARAGDTKVVVPNYTALEAYRAAGGYQLLRKVRDGAIARRGDHRHAAGCRPARPGRRRFSGRQEMGDRPHLSRPPPDVDQRRRRRARHLQGPHLSRARSAPHLRRRADRRACRRGRAHLFLHARRISRGARHPAHARSPRWRPPASPSRASSSCAVAPAPISAARKARCWKASKASAACRATARPISPKSACSAARR